MSRGRVTHGARPPTQPALFATITDAARVGVGVAGRGSDQGQATPMLEQIEARTGVRPTELLVDGGYPGHDAIDQASRGRDHVGARARAADLGPGSGRHPATLTLVSATGCRPP